MSKTSSKFWRERLVKASLDLVVLGLLMDRDRWGYEINMQIRDRFDVYLSAGTLYPLLHSLEENGLLEGIWESEKGRGRRIYRISEKGREFLTSGQRALDDLLKRLRIERESSQA
ncbi:MAG: PadR family transcriptional regulator [archaeon]